MSERSLVRWIDLLPGDMLISSDSGFLLIKIVPGSIECRITWYTLFGPALDFLNGRLVAATYLKNEFVNGCDTITRDGAQISPTS